MAIEEYNAERNRAKVNAGLKGGNLFQSPNTPQAMTVVDGIAPESQRMLGIQKPTQMGSVDAWASRGKGR